MIEVCRREETAFQYHENISDIIIMRVRSETIIHADTNTTPLTVIHLPGGPTAADLRQWIRFSPIIHIQRRSPFSSIAVDITSDLLDTLSMESSHDDILIDVYR